MFQVSQLQFETEQLQSRRCLASGPGDEEVCRDSCQPWDQMQSGPSQRCPASGQPLCRALPEPVLLQGEERLPFVCLKAKPRKGWRRMYFPLSEKPTNNCCFPAPYHSKRLEHLWKAASDRGAQRHSQARAGKYSQGGKGAPEDLKFITRDLGLQPGEVIQKPLCSSRQCL